MLTKLNPLASETEISTTPLLTCVTVTVLELTKSDAAWSHGKSSLFINSRIAFADARSDEAGRSKRREPRPQKHSGYHSE